jgi:hypothetical protein
MQSWPRIWRIGLAPQLSTLGLESLRHALASDDDRLLQGATTSPPALESMRDRQVEAACALGYCGWQGDGLTTVAQVTVHFQTLCLQADRALGQPAACRLFLNWFDSTPRSAMRRQLLAEVNRTLREWRRAA